MAPKRKICVTGPMRIKLAEKMLRDEGASWCL